MTSTAVAEYHPMGEGRCRDTDKKIPRTYATRLSVKGAIAISSCKKVCQKLPGCVACGVVMGGMWDGHCSVHGTMLPPKEPDLAASHPLYGWTYSDAGGSDTITAVEPHTQFRCFTKGNGLGESSAWSATLVERSAEFTLRCFLAHSEKCIITRAGLDSLMRPCSVPLTRITIILAIILLLLLPVLLLILLSLLPVYYYYYHLRRVCVRLCC